MAFKELSGGSGGTIYKWGTPGQVVEGRYVGSKRGKVFNGRPSTLGTVKNAAGVDVVFGMTTVLESQFLENEIKPGTVIRITYLGLEPGKNGGNGYKNFKLEIDDSSTPTGASPAASAPQTPAPAATASADATGSEYDILAGKLSLKVGASAAAPMLNALGQMYPDPAERLKQLQQACKSQGVA